MIFIIHISSTNFGALKIFIVKSQHSRILYFFCESKENAFVLNFKQKKIIL